MRVSAGRGGRVAWRVRMVGMADGRRMTGPNGASLRVVGDDGVPDAAELAQLRAELVAVGVADEVLEALDAPGGPEEIIGRLIESGALPSPTEALAEMLASWKPLLRRTSTALDAELMGAEFLGLLDAMAPNVEDLPDMLIDLVGQAERSGAPEALAMLRVMAVLGPEAVRPTASAAADRLVSAGVVDPVWARELGRPEVRACFGYGDGGLGSQESVAVTFRYGRREHALVVLIDHDLGGGVKDCFPTDRPDRIRVDFQQAAHQFGLDFQDYTPAQAHEVLSRALAVRPCPVEPDQLDDVHDYLDLLRARMTVLADHGSGRGSGRGASVRPARVTPSRTVHRVKVGLRGAKPPIWRRLEVPSEISLDRLHQAVQLAFGWEGYHMWVFETPAGDYGIPDRELGHRGASGVTVDEVAPRAGDRIRYLYDFGDGWEHDLVVEDVLTAEPGVAYPRCLAGRRACPPEDCGGMWGYADLLKILADPDHEEHDERVEWLGLTSASEFDAAAFDRNEVDRALGDMAKILSRR